MSHYLISNQKENTVLFIIKIFETFSRVKKLEVHSNTLNKIEGIKGVYTFDLDESVMHDTISRIFSNSPTTLKHVTILHPAMNQIIKSNSNENEVLTPLRKAILESNNSINQVTRVYKRRKTWFNLRRKQEISI